jgi:hypothetical protein
MATTITHCKIEADKALDLDTDDGHVVFIGESPHTTATISWFVEEPGVYNEAKKKWEVRPEPYRAVRRDRLVEAEVKKGRDGTTTITGVSEYLRNEVELATDQDCIVTIKVGPGKGCKGC